MRTDALKCFALRPTPPSITFGKLRPIRDGRPNCRASEAGDQALFITMIPSTVLENLRSSMWKSSMDTSTITGRRPRTETGTEKNASVIKTQRFRLLSATTRTDECKFSIKGRIVTSTTTLRPQAARWEGEKELGDLVQHVEVAMNQNQCFELCFTSPDGQLWRRRQQAPNDYALMVTRNRDERSCSGVCCFVMRRWATGDRVRKSSTAALPHVSAKSKWRLGSPSSAAAICPKSRHYQERCRSSRNVLHR